MRLKDLRWYIMSCLILIIAYGAIAFVCYNTMVKARVRNSMAELGKEASSMTSTLATTQVNSYYDNFQQVGYETYYTITATQTSFKNEDAFNQSVRDGNKFFISVGTDYELKTEYDATLTYYVVNAIQAKNSITQAEFEAGDYYRFENDRYTPDTSYSLIRSVSVTAPSSKFKDIAEGERKILLQRYKDFRSGTTETNTDYYFFFLRTNKEGDYEVGCVPLKTIIDLTYQNAKKDYLFDTLVFSEAGMIYEYTADEKSSGSLVTKLFGSSLDVNDLMDSNRSFVWSFDSGDYVITTTSFFDVYLTTFISVDDAYLSIDWVTGQLGLFFVIGVVIIIIILFILIGGCKKASKLLRVDRHTLEATKAIVIRIDNNGKIIFTNKTFKQLYGIRHIDDVSGFIDVETGEPIINTVKQNKPFECSVALENGESMYLQLTPIHILSSYYLMGSEETEDYNRRKYLYLMNGRNEITNVDNNFSLINDFALLKRSAGLEDLAFVQYNICKHEEIVAVFGRTNFNILLNEFVTILKEQYEGMRLYQINDDKFIIACPNNELSEVEERIYKSLDVLRRPIQIKNNHIYVKVKVVVYNLNVENDEIEIDEIKKKLDLAYRNIADFSSKDYIVYEPAMDGVIEAAETMEKDLVNGLQNDEFRMFLQPQYDIVQNRIDGFEALIRWTNPKYFDKSPQAFIELAEQRGYILDIGRYVIKESFRLAKQLERYNVHISMNVSPIQLLQVGFVQQIIDEFKLLKLKPGSIAIEITETFLMGNFQLMTEKLKRLKEAGFSIHLDDFCTGYSSMLYLKDLPVDTLKIDKEFTKYITNNKVHASIVKTICDLGNSLDMDIICEGVETQEQSDMVKKFGARLIQGYLIAKAVPYEEALNLLEKYNTKRR